MENNKIQKGSCNQCGMCCLVICVPFSPEEFRRKRKNGPDFNFAFRNWKNISKKKAFQLNPHLSIWITEKDRYFYTCSYFNRKTKQCEVHSLRPRVCRDYPWYYGSQDNEPFYSDDCGYKIDREMKRLINLLKIVKNKKRAQETKSLDIAIKEHRELKIKSLVKETEEKCLDLVVNGV